MFINAIQYFHFNGCTDACGICGNFLLFFFKFHFMYLCCQSFLHFTFFYILFYNRKKNNQNAQESRPWIVCLQYVYFGWEILLFRVFLMLITHLSVMSKKKMIQMKEKEYFFFLLLHENHLRFSMSFLRL